MTFSQEFLEGINVFPQNFIAVNAVSIFVEPFTDVPKCLLEIECTCCRIIEFFQLLENLCGKEIYVIHF